MCVYVLSYFVSPLSCALCLVSQIYFTCVSWCVLSPKLPHVGILILSWLQFLLVISLVLCVLSSVWQVAS